METGSAFLIDGGHAAEWIELTEADFILTLDHLMKKMLVLVQQYFQGERRLFI